jgi:hypothetical protein
MEASPNKDKPDTPMEKQPPPWMPDNDDAWQDDLPSFDEMVGPGEVTDNAGLPHIDIVTQEQLAAFLRLQPLAARFEKLREQLKTALADGTPVEPGPYTAEVNIREVRRLTVDHLIRAFCLSREQLAAARATASPQRYRHLSVRLVRDVE